MPMTEAEGYWSAKSLRVRVSDGDVETKGRRVDVHGPYARSCSDVDGFLEKDTQSVLRRHLRVDVGSWTYLDSLVQRRQMQFAPNHHRQDMVTVCVSQLSLPEEGGKPQT